MSGAAAAAGGFSLIEVLVATTILAVALTSLAQLFVLAVRANMDARETTMAAVAARGKMEELRALAWTVDSAGLPLSDAALAGSPPGTLAANIPGYCDFLDARGRPVGGGTIAPRGAVVVRRWSVDPLPGGAGDTIVVQVLAGAWGGQPNAPSLRDAVRLVAVRTRKAM